MKIAIYSGNIPSTTFIENLIDGLSESGIEIILFGKIAGKINSRENVELHPTPIRAISLIMFTLKESLKTIVIRPKLLFQSVAIQWKKKKRISSLIKELGLILPILNNPVDIFHIQWGKTVRQNREMFELLQSKFVLSLRGAHINYSPLTDLKLADAYREYFPSIDGFHAVSKAIGKEALRYGANGNKIRVIYSSVKEELFKKNATVFDINNKLEIISIGRFHWKKGYHYALDAMKILKDSGINFRYTIIATGKIPEEILFLLDEYDLSENVEILSGMDYDALISKLENSHLLILPSVEEGIANVVLEAMAVGVPVLTTNCGGMEEVIDDNVNGYITKVRDPEEIAEKIISFAKPVSADMNNIINNAKNTIKSRFTRKKQIKEFIKFYQTIVSK